MGMVSLNGADPEQSLGWDYHSQGPIETGALPDAPGVEHGSGEIASEDPGLTFVDIGGIRYRVGLDTGS